MQACISDVKFWTKQSKLNLTDDMIQAFHIRSNRTTFPDAQSATLRVGTADILFTICARSLSFMIPDNLTLDKPMSNVCRSVYVEIKQTGSIHQYLTVEAIKTNFSFQVGSL